MNRTIHRRFERRRIVDVETHVSGCSQLDPAQTFTTRVRAMGQA